MNAITPENEMPPAQSTAASGTFPTEQTNEKTATSGPTTTFSASCAAPDECVTKSPLKKLSASAVVDVSSLRRFGVPARLLLEPPRDREPDSGPHERDQHDPADELGQR